MKVSDAFLVGYRTAYAAIPFRGFEVLHALAVGMTGELAAAINAQIEAHRSKNQQTVGMVLLVEEILAEAGLPRSAKPHTFADYERWSNAARDVVALSTTRGSALDGALIIGETVATLQAALVMEDIHLSFRVRAPDEPRLRTNSQVATLEVSVAGDMVFANSKHPGIPPIVRTSLLEWIEYLNGPLSTPHDEVRARAIAVREALNYVNDRVPALAAAFTP